MTSAWAKAIFVLCALGWYAIRWPHARRSRRERSRFSDFSARERILVAVAATGLGVVPFIHIATRTLRFADYPFIPLLGWLGLLTFCAALWLFYRTHNELGHNWSMTLEVRDGNRLVSTGVYARIRHPMYAAFWLWAVAQALLLSNWIAGPAGLVGFGTLYFLRVGAEERLMLDAFGEEYRDYMKRTARIVPRPW